MTTESFTPAAELYAQWASKKRDFPALILRSTDGQVVYSHYGTGTHAEQVFGALAALHGQPLLSTMLASISEHDRTLCQNWLDLLYDEVYVELMVPEDIMKMAPSFTLTWTNGQNYEIHFEAIRTENVYGYVLVWLEPHGETKEQKLAVEIIELLRELRQLPGEVINNLREYLPEVKDHLNLSKYASPQIPPDLLYQLSRHLHAAKGTIFFLGLSVLGNALHDTESALEILREHWKPEDGLPPVKATMNQLNLLMTLTEGIITRVYNAQAQAAGSENITVPVQEYYGLLDTASLVFQRMKAISGQHPEIFGLARALYQCLIRLDSVPLTSLFERLASSTAQLSKELKKAVSFSVSSNIPTIHLPHDLFESLWNALYQVVKNAIDHGVESPEVRLTRHKPATAQIKLSVEIPDSETLILRMRDDGQGIDPHGVLRAALKRGLITPEKAEALKAGPVSEIYDLIFLPDFTTKPTVTTVSGRGVGTDVIRKEIEAYSGQVLVLSELSQWTEFVLRLPLKHNHIIVEDSPTS